MPGSGFFSRFFGGKPRVDLWRRYERMRESVTGTMSHFYKVRELSTGRVLGLKIINHEKSDPIEGRYRGLKKPSEGEIGMLLKGPNIAKTLEWGETTTGET